MAPRITIAEIKTEDERWKPGGRAFDDDALTLSALFDHRGRRITFNHLKRLGMGDPDNASPLCVGLIPRLTESISVLYRMPATRRLKKGNKTLSDNSPASRAFADLSQRMCLDNVWQLIDSKRNLFRQCAVSFVESAARESVQVRIIEPHSIYRMPTSSAADDIEQDQAVALLIRDSTRIEEQRFQLWQHEDDGTWRLWIVDGRGTMQGEQPYGEDGFVPFDEIPLLMVYDDLPAGQAYLPIPESRVDFALNVNALVNDLAYLVKLEAHTLKAVRTDDPAAVPTQVGPGHVWKLPRDADVEVLAHTPQIANAVLTIERMLSMFCLSESLPPDYFSADRKFLTGPALKVAERDLEARRQRQQPLAVDDERRAFRKYRQIHNYYATEWDKQEIDEDVDLVTSFSRQWQPIDAKELQQTSGFDLAIGTASVIDYMQERYNLDRATAVTRYEQVQTDRDEYPVKNQQNPAALIESTNAALGPESAQKTPGAFNPELATSTEGASIVDAVRRSHESGEMLGAEHGEHTDPGYVDGSGMEPAITTEPPSSGEIVATQPPIGASVTGVEKAQDAALNGAQIESALLIVDRVANGTLPRQSGIAMLIRFFNLDMQAAEEIMGEVGRGFRPRAPEERTSQ